MKPLSLLFLFFTMLHCGLPAAESADRPNIVSIIADIADDLGWADVAFHGGSAPTPNLDQLVPRCI